jgi:antitoxin PrlF
MRVTRKGQITVPKRLRERFGITPEVDLEFREERGRLVLVKAAPEASVRAVRGSVKQLPFGKDVDEYLRATRGSR